MGQTRLMGRSLEVLSYLMDQRFGILRHPTGSLMLLRSQSILMGMESMIAFVGSHGGKPRLIGMGLQVAMTLGVLFLTRSGCRI